MTIAIPSHGKDPVLGSIARMSGWTVGLATFGVLTSVLFAFTFASPGLSIEGAAVSPHWKEVPMPAPLESHRAVVVQVGGSEFLYVIGGKASGTSISNKVYFAQLNPDGSLDGWTPTLSIYRTPGLQEHSAVAVGGRIYVLGGRGNSWDTFSSVYCAKPDAMGRISDWIPVASMPTGLTLHGVVAVDNVIYVIGGGSSQKKGYVREVWAADVTGNSCSNLQWSSRPEQSLPRALAALSATAVRLDNGRKFVYVIGGYDGNAHKQVWRAEVDSSGKLEPWVSLGDLSLAPSGFFRHVSAISGRYLYVIGGTRNGYDWLNAVYRARIRNDGSLGAWSALDAFPVPVFNHAAAVSAPGRIYVLGGSAGSGILDRGYYTPLLAFEKSASPPGSVTYGDTINYTLRLTNLGVRDFETLDITDTVQTNVPTTLEFHLPGDCSRYSNDTITCTVSNLTTGNTTDLSFAVTISQPTPALHSATAASQVPLIASTSPTKTWQRTCSAARLEVVGVGLSDSNILPITRSETIVSDIRVQAAFRPDGGALDDVTFFSGGVPYPPIEPPSADDSSVVYEQDVPVSDVVGVMFSPVDGVQADALTAYFLRSTSEELSLAGHSMNRSVYHSTYTDVVKLPLPMRSGNVTVRAVVTSNNRPEGVIRLAVQAGGVSRTITFTEPNHGHYLDIRELQLSGVPTTTNEITVIAESPSENGESFSLVGLIAETECTPLRVSNTATVCENADTGSWCWRDIYINADGIYLPIVLKDGL